MNSPRYAFPIDPNGPNCWTSQQADRSTGGLHDFREYLLIREGGGPTRRTVRIHRWTCARCLLEVDRKGEITNDPADRFRKGGRA